MDPKKCAVSIIVPIYNVEDYLEGCLNSLINQTLKDIEIILVNDCSTDGSREIVLRFLEKDSRIVYIEQDSNQGQGISRNIALKQAKGDYVLFVDSDDHIALNAAETMYNKAVELNLDILESNYYKVYPNEIIKQNNPVFPAVLNGNDYFEKIPFTVGVIWNKLWKTAFIRNNNLKFVKEIFEDAIFISQAVPLAERIFRIEYFSYYYIIRENSTMTSKASKKHIDGQMKVVKFLEYSYIMNKQKPGSDQRLKLLLYSLPSLATYIVDFKPKDDEENKLKLRAKKFLRQKHKSYGNKAITCSKIGHLQKALIFISPYLMSFALKKFKK